MNIKERSESKFGYQVVLHGTDRNGREISLTVHTDKSGKPKESTRQRVKVEHGIDLPERLF